MPPTSSPREAAAALDAGSGSPPGPAPPAAAPRSWRRSPARSRSRPSDRRLAQLVRGADVQRAGHLDRALGAQPEVAAEPDQLRATAHAPAPPARRSPRSRPARAAAPRSPARSPAAPGPGRRGPDRPPGSAAPRIVSAARRYARIVYGLASASSSREANASRRSAIARLSTRHSRRRADAPLPRAWPERGVSAQNHTPQWWTLRGAGHARAVEPGVPLRADNLQSLTPRDVRRLVEEEALEVVLDLRPTARSRSRARVRGPPSRWCASSTSRCIGTRAAHGHRRRGQALGLGGPGRMAGGVGDGPRLHERSAPPAGSRGVRAHDRPRRRSRAGALRRRQGSHWSGGGPRARRRRRGARRDRLGLRRDGERVDPILDRLLASETYRGELEGSDPRIDDRTPRSWSASSSSWTRTSAARCGGCQRMA